jgi:orotate phosphoribosyltransferase
VSFRVPASALIDRLEILVNRPDDIRARAIEELRRFGVLMLDGHFDYGNGYHGRTYLNPHQLFRYPSTIWRLAQDLLDLVPSDVTAATEVVAGPATGGALLAHTIAGLLDSRRSLTHPPCSFAPFGVDLDERPRLRSFYRDLVVGRRVLLADDVLNTGQTLHRCAELVRAAGGTVLAAVVICDRLASIVDIGAPIIALTEYAAQENYATHACPLCHAGIPITAF